MMVTKWELWATSPTPEQEKEKLGVFNTLKEATDAARLHAKENGRHPLEVDEFSGFIKIYNTKWKYLLEDEIPLVHKIIKTSYLEQPKQQPYDVDIIENERW